MEEPDTGAVSDKSSARASSRTSGEDSSSDVGSGGVDNTWRFKCSCGEVHTVRNGRPLQCHCGRKAIFGL